VAHFHLIDHSIIGIDGYTPFELSYEEAFSIIQMWKQALTGS
jgi:hypothetical protein